jgi:uncharacterized membrane protein YphA (DoxX/SURF4 family)
VRIPVLHGPIVFLFWENPMDRLFKKGNRLILSYWPYLAVRLGLGVLFLWAGAVKIVDPRAFAKIIDGYGLVPDPLLAPVAIAVPVLELLAGLGLVFDVRGSIKLTLALLVLFTAVLGYGVASGLEIDCGCLSAEEIRAGENLRNALMRDIGLLGALGYLIYWKRAKARTESHVQVRKGDLANEMG